MLVLCPQKGQHLTPDDDPALVGERWGCLVLDRSSRCVVAAATGRHDADLVARAVAQTAQRTAQRPFAWCSDGGGGRGMGYLAVLTRQYRQPLRRGTRGRPPFVVPDALRLTQIVKQRDVHGRLLGVETRAALGAPVTPPGTMHVERRHGVCRDRLSALARKTHAFAKTVATWDALLALHCFEQNWLRPHPALRVALGAAAAHEPRFAQRTPAMALGLADHPWTWCEFLTTSIHVST